MNMNNDRIQLCSIIALTTCLLCVDFADAAGRRRLFRRRNRPTSNRFAQSQPYAPPLFDGKTLDNWTTVSGEPVTTGWEVVDGVIHLNKDQGRAGHILSKHEYGDFELTFDWKIAAGGNSGLKYRVRNYGNKTLGCEYQIYDDESAGNLPPRGSTGSLYAIYEPNENKQLNPAGEFNSTRILVRGNLIEHWLNGKLIVTAIVGSDEWHERVAASKFDKEEDFGENRFGKIMLTDHGSEVWYRDLQLTPLW